MEKEKLLRLADLLDTVKPDRFNMAYWSTVGFAEKECGTSACAMGWATTIFPELRLVDHPHSNEVALLQYEDWDGFHAVSSFFDISYDSAEWLFDGDCYDTNRVGPSEVAKRIRKSVADELDTIFVAEYAE